MRIEGSAASSFPPRKYGRKTKVGISFRPLSNVSVILAGRGVHVDVCCACRRLYSVCSVLPIASISPVYETWSHLCHCHRRRKGAKHGRVPLSTCVGETPNSTVWTAQSNTFEQERRIIIACPVGIITCLQRVGLRRCSRMPPRLDCTRHPTQTCGH